MKWEAQPTMPSGLTEKEAKERRVAFGPNSLPKGEKKWIGLLLWSVVSEPMVFLLIGCGAIYFFLGDPQESFLLMGFLFLILAITVYQEQKAEKALQSLREIASPRAVVIRDGLKNHIAGIDLVVGDIVLLNEGDRVPADLLLLNSQNLTVDESLLTGESASVLKQQSEGQQTFLYSGTTVVKGSGWGRVVAIGKNTELGKIGQSLQETREPTALEKESRRVVWIVALFAGFLCSVAVLSFGIFWKDWMGGFLSGLTLAMGILPNELPAVLAIFLALGAWRLSKKKVLTRRSAVIEALGAATVLCVDKTGTLTENRMSVRKLWNSREFYSISELHIDSLPEDFHELVEFGILAGEKDPLDPMDKAFQTIGLQFLVESEHLHPSWTLVQQYPLTSDLLALTHAWKPLESESLPVASKGAPEAIIDLCHLDPIQTEKINLQVQAMAEEGLRVLGVAKANVKESMLPKEQHDIDFIFLGLVGLQDPIRKEVPQAIQDCRSAGIRVIMITGDHPDTAKSIAREIGLDNPEEILLGSELQSLTGRALALRLSKTSVCARMVPEQKLHLIQVLKGMGEIVAMTGDGVNDAPALKNANIGIAMGKRGTEVAREAASLVLLEDDFGSIVTAIRHGRKIFENLVHAISYLLVVHIPIAGISILPILFHLPLVLLPVHIAFLHLIIEPACSIAFEADPESPNLMNRPPRRIQESFFSKEKLLPVLAKGLFLLLVVVVVFLVSLKLGFLESEARAVTFASLFVSQILLLYSERGSSLQIANPLFHWISMFSIFFLLAVLFIPFLLSMFHFSMLSLTGWGLFVASICFQLPLLWVSKNIGN